MTFAEVQTAARAYHLSVLGTVTKDVPDNLKMLLLLGPDEPDFWPAFTASPEYNDGSPNPLDRWSARVVGLLADQLGASAYFPFSGPPYRPFIEWAKASGQAHVSPVGLLVHNAAGLMVSYRGALGFQRAFHAPAPLESPCITCHEKPCLTACPVDAFASGTYDLFACKADLDRPHNDCMSKGCAVRRACPVSQSFGRLEPQSAFHMRAFK